MCAVRALSGDFEDGHDAPGQSRGVSGSDFGRCLRCDMRKCRGSDQALAMSKGRRTERRRDAFVANTQAF